MAAAAAEDETAPVLGQGALASAAAKSALKVMWNMLVALLLTASDFATSVNGNTGFQAGVWLTFWGIAGFSNAEHVVNSHETFKRIHVHCKYCR